MDGIVLLREDHVLESVEEHHVGAWLLSELSELDPADETFDAKAQAPTDPLALMPAAS
ncbi:hypothetical protein [Catenuloplanes japonicus]|uniref:hypothetical protein n=1 Tax=Catenuloplanes japonicus TaxID=33876 RepID=UPI000AA6B82F|nr:hypothetical protein [Catenuloplanes japonicus]